MFERRGLLRAYCHVLTDGVPCEELGAAHFDRLEPGKQARYHLRRLVELGFAVYLQPPPAA